MSDRSGGLRRIWNRVRPRSIRGRVTAGAVVVLVIVVSGGLAASILLLRDLITNQARDRAAMAARHVVEQVATERYPGHKIPDSDPIRRLQVVQWDTGEVLAASDTLRGLPALTTEQPRRGGFRLDTVICTEHLGDRPGDCYLVVGYALADSAYGDVMVLGAAHAPYILASGTLEMVLIGSGTGLLTVTALVIWFGVGRALRPVELISDQMEAISATDLHRRLRVPRTHDEIAHLARTANASLDRLEEAVTRQRRFVSDASHELRNPIAGMRAKLEVELSDPRPDPRERERLLTSLLSDTERLENIVSDLLELARLDTDLAASREPFDLAVLVQKEFGARKEVVDLHVHTRGEVPVCMDRLRMTRVLTNLVANAERHAQERIDIVVDRDDTEGCAVVEVHDDGSGVPEADRERIFERFARLRESRELDPEGSGLGLAISREIVKAYGGTLRAGHSDLLGGALFTLRVPLGTETEKA
ncbi:MULTISPECIES: sensor histidine kinase [unclassified Nocardiopsis]|uniref:sensor histidine kinase n=1 Tax=Nocardiopsis TaxID=2013 RepID=UPI00387AF612